MYNITTDYNEQFVGSLSSILRSGGMKLTVSFQIKNDLIIIRDSFLSAILALGFYQLLPLLFVDVAYQLRKVPGAFCHFF